MIINFKIQQMKNLKKTTKERGSINSKNLKKIIEEVADGDIISGSKGKFNSKKVDSKKK